MTPTEIVLAASLATMVGLVLLLTLRSHRPAQRVSGSGKVEVRLQPDPSILSTDRKCSSCRFFDLEEGQAAIARFPAALVAYQHVSPAEQATTNPSWVPLKAKWTEMGACAKHNLCVWTNEGPQDRMRQLEDLITPETPREVLLERIAKKQLTILTPDGRDCWEPRA